MTETQGLLRQGEGRLGRPAPHTGCSPASGQSGCHQSGGANLVLLPERATILRIEVVEPLSKAFNR